MICCDCGGVMICCCHCSTEASFLHFASNQFSNVSESQLVLEVLHEGHGDTEQDGHRASLLCLWPQVLNGPVTYDIVKPANIYIYIINIHYTSLNIIKHLFEHLYEQLKPQFLPVSASKSHPFGSAAPQCVQEVMGVVRDVSSTLLQAKKSFGDDVEFIAEIRIFLVAILRNSGGRFLTHF